MKLEIEISEQQYNNIIELESVNIGRVPYKGIIMYAVNAIKRGKPLEQEPVLDKIRAEINNLTVYYTTKDKGINLISQKAVNRIFDKYKAESEGT